MQYPYHSAIVLTDSLFVSYGGHTGTSTSGQRSAAYLMAEMAATEDIGSFLLPTAVTGTFQPNPFHRYIADQGYVTAVNKVIFLDAENTELWSQSGLGSDSVGISGDGERGIIDIGYSELGYMPYKVQISYTAGIPSGTSFQPNVLMALTTYADIILNEITGYGNEAPGDIGVQNYQNQQYREERVALIRTQFGTSARAQFASQLLTNLRKLRKVGL